MAASIAAAANAWLVGLLFRIAAYRRFAQRAARGAGAVNRQQKARRIVLSLARRRRRRCIVRAWRSGWRSRRIWMGSQFMSLMGCFAVHALRATLAAYLLPPCCATVRARRACFTHASVPAYHRAFSLCKRALLRILYHYAAARPLFFTLLVLAYSRCAARPARAYALFRTMRCCRCSSGIRFCHLRAAFRGTSARHRHRVALARASLLALPQFAARTSRTDHAVSRGV